MPVNPSWRDLQRPDPRFPDAGTGIGGITVTRFSDEPSTLPSGRLASVAIVASLMVGCAGSDQKLETASMTAIRMGKHVYCEKPLTHSVKEARALTEAARAAGMGGGGGIAASRGGMLRKSHL